MQQMKSYTTFLTEKGDLVIVIPFLAKTATNPKILYAGKEHALFYRAPEEDVIILDYLNEVAQIVLRQAGKVLMFEVNIENQSIVNNYFVPVIMTEKLPHFELTQTVPEKN